MLGANIVAVSIGLQSTRHLLNLPTPFFCLLNMRRIYTEIKVLSLCPIAWR